MAFRPGAADDAIGVGIMIEIARILIERNEPFNHSLVLVRDYSPQNVTLPSLSG